MPKELTKEFQDKIKMGIQNMPCPECGELLDIKSEDLPTGGNSVGYHCVNKDCRSIAGIVIIPWYSVISSALKSHLVKIAVLAFAVLFTAIGSWITSMKSTGEPKQLVECTNGAWEHLEPKLKQYECLEAKDTEPKKINIECINGLFLALNKHREAEMWIMDRPYRAVILSFLEGKKLGLEEIARQEAKEEKSRATSSSLSSLLAIADHVMPDNSDDILHGQSKGKSLGHGEAIKYLRMATDTVINEQKIVNASFRSSKNIEKPQPFK